MPIRSELDIKIKPAKDDDAEISKIIRQIGYFIDNPSKTRAVFEINKGSNKFKDIKVNSKIEKANRRIPFENMIYIADGPSDVPVFSLLKQNGGQTLAVYPKGDQDAFAQIDRLSKDGRIDFSASANYLKDEQAHMWLTKQVKDIAQSIFKKLDQRVQESASIPPTHITE
jgi:hypothetical protein